MKTAHPLRPYHPLHSLLTSTISSICPMDQYHFRQAQRKAEAVLLVSMRRQQQKLETTPPGLPSSVVLGRSLRLQLMTTLQRLASERKLTVIEAKEMILRTLPQDLTMEQWFSLELARNLVKIRQPP